MPFLLLIPREKKEKRHTIKPLNILIQDFSLEFFVFLGKQVLIFILKYLTTHLLDYAVVI